MAQIVDPQNWIRVGEIIARAQAQGCELREPNIVVTTPWGRKRFRYLHNPQTGGTFDLTDDADDEILAPSSVYAAERRLGISLRNP